MPAACMGCCRGRRMIFGGHLGLCHCVAQPSGPCMTRIWAKPRLHNRIICCWACRNAAGTSLTTYHLRSDADFMASAAGYLSPKSCFGRTVPGLLVWTALFMIGSATARQIDRLPTRSGHRHQPRKARPVQSFVQHPAALMMPVLILGRYLFRLGSHPTERPPRLPSSTGLASRSASYRDLHCRICRTDDRRLS